MIERFSPFIEVASELGAMAPRSIKRSIALMPWSFGSKGALAP